MLLIVVAGARAVRLRGSVRHGRADDPVRRGAHRHPQGRGRGVVGGHQLQRTVGALPGGIRRGKLQLQGGSNRPKNGRKNAFIHRLCKFCRLLSCNCSCLASPLYQLNFYFGGHQWHLVHTRVLYIVPEFPFSMTLHVYTCTKPM